MSIDLSPYIKAGDLVFCAQLGAAPQGLVKALIEQAEALGGVRFLNSFPLDPGADRLTSTGGWVAGNTLVRKSLEISLSPWVHGMAAFSSASTTRALSIASRK